ncbi:MAG: hypothetical protein Q7J98_04065 [Kiritimatiellia bacterium]|nr:hypothetical protein [Kiritimatiellia bacterium]
MKTIATAKESELHGPAHVLECCLCGEDDRDKLVVEDLGLATSDGELYSFCKDCWRSPELGQDLLNLLGYPGGIKLLESSLDLRVEGGG